MDKPLKLPPFPNEDAERDYWANPNLEDAFEPDDFRSVNFPNLKPSSTTISLRLADGLLNRIKAEAHRQDIPYQSLIKTKLH